MTPSRRQRNGGRDEHGRFAEGNPGGPGRPRREVEHDYLRALAETVSLDDWKRIGAVARDMALDGDAKARDFLARHLVGSATLQQSLTPDEWLLASFNLPTALGQLTDPQLQARITDARSEQERGV